MIETRSRVLPVGLFLLPLAVVLSLALSGCKDLGMYVWADEFVDPAAPADGSYVIGDGDTLMIRVYNQENLTTKAKVRSDGKISLPLLNDVVAAGYSPAILGQQLETRFKDFFRLPTVTVSVEDTRPLTVLVAGEVAKQGQVQLESGAGVLPALLAAGGMNDFAHKDQIFVVRQVPQGAPLRLRFVWQELLRAEGRSAQFRLRSGDTVVVE